MRFTVHFGVQLDAETQADAIRMRDDLMYVFRAVVRHYNHQMPDITRWTDDDWSAFLQEAMRS